MKVSIQLVLSVLAMVVVLAMESMGVEALIRPEEASLAWWWSSAPLTVAIDSALVVSIGFALLAITARPLTAALLTSILLMMLALAHFATLSTLGRPLFPWDVLLFREAMNLWPYLTHLPFGWALGLGAIALAAGLLASLRWGPRLSAAWRVPLAAAVLSLGLWLYPTPGTKLALFHVQNMTWDQITNYRKNGLPLAFLMNLPAANIDRPDDYNQMAIVQALAHRKAHDVDAATPDVIMVMSESFFDVTKLPGVKFEEDPLPNLHRLQQEAASGSLFTPTFGGGTANTEFELLTGHSMRFLPYGSVPYQQYVRKPQKALPSIYRSNGYRTEAVHIFHRWFWDREQVYQQLGIQRFVSMEGLELTGGGYFPHDENLTREMIKALSDSNQPLFLFGVSVEAHGPYERDRYPATSVRFTGPLDEQAQAELATYTEAIKHADEELGKLVDYLDHRGRPAVLLFFGDHLPSIPLTLRQTGLARSPQEFEKLPLRERAALYEVPLLLWNSERHTHRELGVMSTTFLGPLLLEETATEGTPYTEFLDNIRARYPVVTPDFLADSNGDFLEQPPEDWRGIERDWWLLQYDALFGDNYAQHHNG